MFSADDTLKIVNELNKEDGFKSKFKLFFVVLFSLIIFINLNFLIDIFLTPYIGFLNASVIESTTGDIFRNVFLAFLSFFFSFIILELIIRFFKFILSLFRHFFRNYTLSDSMDLTDWEFQGNVLFNKNTKVIHIIQSNLGLILKNREWKDYEMTFKFKIPLKATYSHQDEENNQLRRGFGVIFRAKKLGEYYMLKIDSGGYKPHVRDIYWENNGTILNTRLKKKQLNKWINAYLRMENNHLFIRIGVDKFDFEIPTHSDIAKDHTESSKSLDDLPYTKISFRNKGSVGFRSASTEEVYIKEMTVRNIIRNPFK